MVWEGTGKRSETVEGKTLPVGKDGWLSQSSDDGAPDVRVLSVTRHTIRSDMNRKLPPWKAHLTFQDCISPNFDMKQDA